MPRQERQRLVRIAAAADADIQGILRWTAVHFGEQHARDYSETILAALQDLRLRSDLAGAHARDDILKGLFTLHVARGKRKGRHIIMFKIRHESEREIVEILRVLHDAMDLPRYV